MIEARIPPPRLSHGECQVNTKVDDGSTITELMSCFLQEQVNNRKFPLLSGRVQYYKNDEGGINTMCKIVDEYANEKSLENIKNLFENGCTLEVVIASFPAISEQTIREIYEKVTTN